MRSSFKCIILPKTRSILKQERHKEICLINFICIFSKESSSGLQAYHSNVCFLHFHLLQSIILLLWWSHPRLHHPKGCHIAFLTTHDSLPYIHFPAIHSLYQAAYMFPRYVKYFNSTMMDYSKKYHTQTRTKAAVA